MKKTNDFKYLKKSVFFRTLFLLILLFFIIVNNKNNKCHIFKYQEDDLTLISAYYRIKSKFPSNLYLKWLNNIVMINKSFVFFANKEFMPTLKLLRPKELHYKTVFIELEMEDFYVYKNFDKEFHKAYEIDKENRYHTIALYMIWAEKSMFLKKVISKNYFNSKCFYWIDSGYFRENKIEMKKFINNWPSTKKCFEDKRLLMGQIGKFSEIEKQKIINFDLNEHQKLQSRANVVGGLFGGQKKYILKFVDLYYYAIKLFIKRKIFIGKDQNIFTFIAFSHPELVHLVLFSSYFGFKTYLA